MPWIDYIQPGVSPGDIEIFAYEHTMEVVEHASVNDTFCWLATWLRGANLFINGVIAQKIAFVHQSIGPAFHSKGGSNLYLSSQQESGGSPTIDGIAQIPDESVAPRWGIVFGNVDGAGYTGKNVHNRDHFTPPVTLKLRIEKSGTVFNPTGDLNKDAPSGSEDFVPLPSGEYALWDAYVDIDGGGWNHILTWYILESELPELQWPPTFFLNELFHASGKSILDFPAEVKYSGVRVFDNATERWHTISRWRRAGGGSFSPAQDEHGWSTEKPGKLVFRSGHATDIDTQLRTNQAYLFRDFEYVMLDADYPTTPTETPMVFWDYTSTTLGAQTITGEHWRIGTQIYPYVREDSVLGWWHIHPGGGTGTLVALKFVALEEGFHYFIGQYARNNVNRGQGDGVVPKIYYDNGVTRELLYQAEISSDHDVDFNDPFGGTGVANFNIQKYLKVGEVVYFACASSPTDPAEWIFDNTVFQTQVFWDGALFSASPPPTPPEPIPAIGEAKITLIFSNGAEVDLGLISGDTSIATIRTKPLDFVAIGQRHSTRKKQVQGIRFEFDPPPTGLTEVEIYTRDLLSDTPESQGIFPVSADGFVRCRIPNRRYYEFEFRNTGTSVRWTVNAVEIFGVSTGDRKR